MTLSSYGLHSWQTGNASAPVQPSSDSRVAEPSVLEAGWHWIPVVGTVASAVLLLGNLLKAAGLGVAALFVGNQGRVGRDLKGTGRGIAKYAIGIPMSLTGAVLVRRWQRSMQQRAVLRMTDEQTNASWADRTDL